MKYGRSALAAGVIAALALVVAATFAAEPPLQVATTAIATPKAPPVPLLWKVSDRDNSVYLLGSFHMLRADDYPLSQDIDDALDDAESVLFELPPEEMLSKELGEQLAKAAIRTDGTRLRDDLSPELAKRLQQWAEDNARGLKSAALSPDTLQMFDPWFVGLLITIVEAGEQGLDSEHGVDAHLAKAAKDQGKQTGGLETGAQQIAMLDEMPRAQQIQMLEESLSEDTDAKDVLKRLHRLWRAGDADALWHEMGLEMRNEYPALYTRINTERNDAWVPQLEARLTAPGTDDTLVVVGALHLLGSDGVVEKLEKKGYTVERVCTVCKRK